MDKSPFIRSTEKIIIITVFTVLITVSVIGCKNTVNDRATETPPFRKQPEPQEPLIQGSFSGLADEELITLYIQGVGGEWGIRHGNGSWEAVISNAREGERYHVTADVPGYQSTPTSYTIIVLEGKAYVVEDGQTTSKEAKNLNFQFRLIITPTKG